ncbi:MAG TPA: flavodoxin-dependent (E)-4-hydroxy-3-methylbut-2-enyl-diphosphate synthase [Smithellaceae bacterium]|nr:flavodoxin-dependent (E)-4-hydroxy-3-methylbut-2-enyl-diphosphate synthase [Smithella sp.]HNZ11063.1 flavodoxin-dependent (E)-4-hydroxy-3-methylbut-2-enyl-diphosphate synthase [Smithellaceae bacterium]HOQ41882.1 flavodoxin-dependent (E)-4-hydroxy-3-methylbut-2-enyl-diphosphate synthase [Smithellaceae bacterium]HPL65145.1 flavodoxin-dependent (E)-4-hydroxy-3-methylbut-2-enyl-diphosphate synthase [Smithellaceae bacterium]
MPGEQVLKKRRKARVIQVGSVKIGGNEPIVVQSMANTDTRDIEATVRQIHELQEAGCEIVRVAVLDEEAVEAIPAIKKRIQIPLIADIHFHYQLALKAIQNGADGIRINPGNIAPDKIAEIVRLSKERQTVIRIGVNAGSMQKDLIDEYSGVTAEAMCASALRNIEIFEDLGFELIKLSLKSSDVPMMIEAYRLIAAKTDYPLHLGVTEAGTLVAAAIKSALGIGTLLYEGIGDTIRVSVTGNPVLEIPVAYSILRALKIRKIGPEIISCPTCGRCQINLPELVETIEKALAGRKEYIKVALMGCVVNGPGEAADADIGIAGGRGFGMMFKKGVAYKKVEEKDFVPMLLEEIKSWDNEK